MTDKVLATQDESATIESVVIGGDLSRLSPAQRVQYYQKVCQSVGLNPLTKPFDYINLNGRLTLYARKDATDQLRNINKISIEKPEIKFEDDWIIVTVSAHDDNGRSDSDIGVVSKTDMRGNFGNAVMKAVTKAKRRVTLSICGLGWLDETEVETIPDARPVIVDDETGEIQETTPQEIQGGNGKSQSEPEEIYQAVVKAKLSSNEHAARETLTKYCKTGYDTKDKAIAWMKEYRKNRDENDTPAQAATKANAALKGK